MTWHSAHLRNYGTVAKVGHPACLSFIVAEDARDENVLWVTEVWESQASHQASLEAPAAKESFQGADTLIVGFEWAEETRPLRVEWAAAWQYVSQKFSIESGQVRTAAFPL